MEGMDISMKMEDIELRSKDKNREAIEQAKKLRRQFLRYKEAEVVYSIQHKKLMELANEAGAIYRIDATVLINREIFEEYLERFREPSILNKKK